MKKLFLFSVIVLIGFCWFHYNGYYFSCLSNSLPIGIYQRSNKVPGLGDYAAFRLDPVINKYAQARGYIKSDVWLMKKVYAVPGDVVERRDRKIFINGKVVEGLSIEQVDSKGRRLDLFYSERLVLGQGQYWMMSDYNPRSWDSRYFGVVEVDFVMQKIF
ncbi:MAG: signal peptidase I [Candidatus Omnitrophica bacterium]|nr:signal peptidase I [Candidatus Omnitrophota bacterium]